MATLTPADTHTHDDHHGDYITCSKGIMSWLITLDHKRIGVMYVIATLASFLLGGLCPWHSNRIDCPGRDDHGCGHVQPLLHLARCDHDLLGHHSGDPWALGNFVLPIMLGPKMWPSPLNLMSFYLWVLGAGMTVYSMLQGGIDTGWTSTRLFHRRRTPRCLLGGHGCLHLGFSSIFTGLNFIVTVQRLRPPG